MSRPSEAPTRPPPADPEAEREARIAALVPLRRPGQAATAWLLEVARALRDEV